MGLQGSVPEHPLGLMPSGVVSALSLKGPSGNTLVACAEVRADEFEPFGPESWPGQRLVDLFSFRVTRHHLAHTGDKEKDVKAYIRALDSAWGDARADHSCLVVASDTSVPKGSLHQAAASSLVY